MVRRHWTSVHCLVSYFVYFVTLIFFFRLITTRSLTLNPQLPPAPALTVANSCWPACVFFHCLPTLWVKPSLRERASFTRQGHVHAFPPLAHPSVAWKGPGRVGSGGCWERGGERRGTPATSSNATLPLRASIHPGSWHVAVPPPLGSTPTFPPASIRGTMKETEASCRHRAPVMAGGWVCRARGVAFREAVNTTGVRSSMETAFISQTRNNYWESHLNLGKVFIIQHESSTNTEI